MVRALLLSVAAIGLVALAIGSPVRASGLYEASTIVTGMDLRSRPEGLRRIFRQVLTKASGNPAWMSDARVDGIAIDGALQGFFYLDRESNLARHDEQGTRDRPYDLVARFDPKTIETILRSLADGPWVGERPVVAIDVAILPRRGPRFSLRADTDIDERHREALAAAADLYGIDIVVPPAAGWPGPVPERPVLEGELVWSDPDAGWYTNWRFRWNGTVFEWGSRGTGFDPAYRDGLAGLAAILSGHRR